MAFFLTAGFLGMMYYFLPIASPAGRSSPTGCSIISFWGITFFYMWAGSHHLHYTALPQWVQTLGMTFSVMLLVPSWASAGNALLTLNGAWHKVRDDATPALHDGRGGVLRPERRFEGSFMAIRAVQLAVALHRLDRRPRARRRARLGGDDHLRLDLRSRALAVEAGAACTRRGWSRSHFWLALSGTIIYVFAMWNSGIIQGLMWRTYNDSGTLAYSFVDCLVAMHPYYIARAFGGLLFLIGALVGAYNIWMTMRRRARERARAATCAADIRPRVPSQARPAGRGVDRHVDSSHFTTGWNARPSASCSRIVLVVQHRRPGRDRAAVHHPPRRSRTAPDMRLYTPLELAGRNIYIREGCYACHSQMIRTLRDEVERYGPYSLAVESKYDHPMLWGSKRTGPDLARIGEQIFRRLACRASDQSARRGAGIGHAGLRLAADDANCATDDLGHASRRRSARSAYPTPTR